MPRKRTKDTHLPACVYFKHGQHWYVKNSVWHPLGVKLTDALTKYAGLKEAGSGMGSLIDRVLDAHRGKVAPNTLRQYRTAAKRLKEILAEYSPEQVRPKDIAKIKVKLSDTPNMANRHLSFLKLVFSYALEWGEVDANPCVGIRRHNENKRGRYLEDQEFRAIYDEAGPRLRLIMDLLYLTCQRVTDVLRIRLSDITSEGIRFFPRKTRKKTGAQITVAWTPELREVVKKAAKIGHFRAVTLLHGRSGRPPDYSTVSEEWTKACRRAGVRDAQMRDIRAKGLTDAKRQGKDATALAAHADARMTDRYIRRREAPLVHGPSGILDSLERVLDDSAQDAE